ncbi:MAG: hypothetical protein DI555_23365 [Novosphingobium pentaromativorans]|uniref:Uncharacterized protein n=1 Tax=Novosphingobium pentaromativorans TaxID=205844 RepID=A0A2W5QEZ3_9SPHN|nr:MAG: hypothetical protein DI555_23365 [Novosphingobium pentaromativorans]
MEIYTLKFPEEGNTGEKTGALCLDFGAEDAADALVLAHRKADDVRSGQAAELWQGARRLCSIRRAPRGNDVGVSSVRFQTA